MKFSAEFKWFDLWFGVFIDQHERKVHVCPIPTIVLTFAFQHDHDDINARQLRNVKQLMATAHISEQDIINKVGVYALHRVDRLTYKKRLMPWLREQKRLMAFVKCPVCQSMVAEVQTPTGNSYCGHWACVGHDLTLARCRTYQKHCERDKE